MSTILKIDIDTKPFNRKLFDKKLICLGKELQATKLEIALRSTHKGTHIIVIMWGANLSAELTTAAQLFLGSDPYRELYNIGRLYRQEFENWNVLFCSKWKNNKLISHEKNFRDYEIKINEGKHDEQKI